MASPEEDGIASYQGVLRFFGARLLRAGPLAEWICVAPTGLDRVSNLSQASRPGLNNFAPAGLVPVVVRFVFIAFVNFLYLP